MTDIQTETKVLDEKATLQAVKAKLNFLSQNIWLMKKGKDMEVADAPDLMDFLPYTKSVIQVSSQAAYDPASRVIEAMQRQEQVLTYQKQKQQERIKTMQILLYAIDCLPSKEKRCIKEHYVNHASYQQLSMELGVSVSSIGRLLQSGCLHLAQLLHLECYRETVHTTR